MITLWRAVDPTRAVPFDRKNVIGLHQLALEVPGAAALDALYQRLLGSPGVVIEFGPQLLGAGPTRHLMCLIPGGIRLEFVARGG